MLSKEMLNELREILKEDYGKSLDDKELFEFGNNLIAYFELLAKIYCKNQIEKENENKFDSFSKGS